MFSFDELIILMDISSGSVHIIDQPTGHYLDVLKEKGGQWEEADKALQAKYEDHILLEVKKELQELIKQGLLFTPDITSADYQPDTSPIVKALCLHIAHDCNLRCGYCFAGTGAFGGDRSLMDLETGKRAIDYLLQASQNRKHIEIDFFGGEPLLNFQVVKELVLYGNQKAHEKGKIIKFTLTTNGVLLTREVQDFLNNNNMSVVLSLDGRKETNDKMRPFSGGAGSYDLIKDKLVEFVNSRNHQDYYVRGTFTRHNLDFAEDVKHLRELGFREISVEPVVAASNMNYALQEDDLPFLKEQYESLTRYFWNCEKQGEEFNFFHFNVNLEQGPCLPKRLSGCGAGHEYLAVSPQGDLYPCHQFVGREEYKLGNVEDGVIRKDLCSSFQKSHVLNKDECMSCWARYFCSGGCHANNLSYGGSLLQPYKQGCELQKKRLECAIYLQALKFLDDRDQ
ncbi:MAG: thioether cross-link-forming SCIFF peptide maturase [Bacillota bacterium]